MYRIGFITSKDYPKLAHDDHHLFKRASKLWECHILVWDDPTVQWTRFDLLVIRSVWDYVENFERFKKWMETIELLGVNVCNHLNLIRWNSSKLYLRELNQVACIDVVPSLFIDRNMNKSESKTLVDYIQQGINIGKFTSKQNKFVMKPCVGANGYGTFQFNLDNWQEFQERFEKLLSQSDMIIQPFVESILKEGETSFLFFNGQFSHSIIKKPSSQEFRVQEDYGGTVERNVFPAQSEIEIAQKIINYIQSSKGKILYARVDFLRYNGKLCLGECELFEPTLYFMKDDIIVNRFLKSLTEYLPKRVRSISITSSFTPLSSTSTCSNYLNISNQQSSSSTTTTTTTTTTSTNNNNISNSLSTSCEILNNNGISTTTKTTTTTTFTTTTTSTSTPIITSHYNSSNANINTPTSSQVNNNSFKRVRSLSATSTSPPCLTILSTSPSNSRLLQHTQFFTPPTTPTIIGSGMLKPLKSNTNVNRNSQKYNDGLLIENI